MKTSDIKFEYPVLGFTPDGEMWGFPDANSLTSVGPLTLKDRMQDGMELVSADGRRWRVNSIRRLGPADSFLKSIFMALLSTRQSRIEHDLEPLSPLEFQAIRERGKSYVQAFWLNYCDAEDQYDQVIPDRLKQLDEAKNVADIFDILGLDSFMAY